MINQTELPEAKRRRTEEPNQSLAQDQVFGSRDMLGSIQKMLSDSPKDFSSMQLVSREWRSCTKSNLVEVAYVENSAGKMPLRILEERLKSCGNLVKRKDETSDEVTELFFQYCPNLTELHIQGSDDLDFMRMRSYLNSLKKLYINDVNNQDAFVGFLRSAKKIETLHLFIFQERTFQNDQLVFAIANLPHLKELCLRQDTPSEIDVSAIVKKADKLEIFDTSFCNIAVDRIAEMTTIQLKQFAIIIKSLGDLNIVMDIIKRNQNLEALCIFVDQELQPRLLDGNEEVREKFNELFLICCDLKHLQTISNRSGSRLWQEILAEENAFFEFLVVKGYV